MKIGLHAKDARYAAGLGLALFAQGLAAEAQVILLHTGGAETPVTDSRLLEAVSGPNAYVRFDFGLATVEEFIASTFLDSVTLSLEGDSPEETTIFATLDRSGVVWAPPVPGGISLDPHSIVWNEIPFPQAASNLPNRRAYAVSAPIPAALMGQNLTFRIDLYDNMNGLNSTAYLNDLAVVPEPEKMVVGTGLAMAAAALLFSARRRNP